MVTVETKPSAAQGRVEDYVVKNDGVEVFHTASKLEADVVALWVKMQEVQA